MSTRGKHPGEIGLEPFTGCLWDGVIGAIFALCMVGILFLLFRAALS